MRILTLVLLQIAFIFVHHFSSSHGGIRNAKNQQVGAEPKTFVVRYKNGDQTIPVTVVLDYKKQTEYVINMNHRTPAKSVTLYDFKQRTIAYKDLTNRECFLGRLTHQTLNEEMDALIKVQNPVNHQPKIVTLDPRQSALTPTEIRNIAGQKTAVFCRKMNTWLIMPPETHNIQKRNVDDDDFDERTYHRHGFHTVQYSHYGRETRRRFRNSRRNGSRSTLYENKNTSGSSNPGLGVSEASSFPFVDVSPQGSSRTHAKSGEPHIYPENAPSVLAQNTDHRQFHRQASFLKSAPPFTSSHSENDSSHYYKNNSVKNQNDGKESRPYESQLPSNSELYSINVHEQTNRITPEHNNHFPIPESGTRTNGLENPLPTSSATPDKRTSVEKFSDFVTDNQLRSNLAYTSLPPRISELNRYKEEYRPTHRNPEIQNINIDTHSFEKDKKYPLIESETFPNESFSNFTPARNFFSDEDQGEVLENPDVSTNVLEIPKITKKFENLDHSRGSASLLPQTKEDVHDIFEGFYNLRENQPVVPENNLDNLNFFPPENYKERVIVNSKSNPTDNFSTLLQSQINNFTHKNVEENAFLFTTTDIAQTTTSPTLTTIAYNQVQQVTATPRPLSHISGAGLFTFHKNSDSSNPNWKPYQEKSRINLERSYNSVHFGSNEISPHNSQNNLRQIPTTQSSIEEIVNNQVNYNSKNQRSDIPSESDNTHSIEFNSQSNLLRPSQNRNNHSRSSPVPNEVVHEGLSPQQARFHTALRDYKPDQIIIDVERIPTLKPLESLLGFQDRTLIISERPRGENVHSQTIDQRQSEQTSGGTVRSSPLSNGWSSSRGVNVNIPKQYPITETFPLRKSIPQHFQLNVTKAHPHRPVNNLQQRNHFRKHNAPNQPHQTRNFHQPLYPLDNLPPGVSIHPRHPQAPYADMFHSNMPPSLPRESNYRTLKPHRQRHHRKKSKLASSCCRTSGKLNNNLSSCCRNGGPCCSRHHGRTASSRASCCSSIKSNKNEQGFPSRQNQILLTNEAQQLPRAFANNRNGQVFSSPRHQIVTESKISSQHLQRTFADSRDIPTFSTQQNRIVANSAAQSLQLKRTMEDNKDRCLKEKMCRTVYESTQQVIVCRNANIDGCL